MSLNANNTCTVILAGGQGRRMQGQDKGLIEWQGKPLIEHILSQLSSDNIIINANRNIERYRSYGYPVIHDSLDDYQGPLIGILSAMQHCSKQYLLCIPCDSPQPPEHMFSRLSECMTANNTQCAICHDGVRLQPLFALISTALKPELESFINQGKRKVHDFFLQLNPAICDFSDQGDRFHNFNRPEDMQ